MGKLISIVLLLLSSFIIHAKDFDRNFDTDFSKSSLNLKTIIKGGPGKDGIPAIDNPKFVKIEKSNQLIIKNWSINCAGIETVD